ncbi:hypothetical protein KI387_013293 [Taxus chinensis]|uniref:Uncharacterized protein n=1 Tax=Taxus chinensis TaxID=29808 RepID=A0AA38CJG0_TAXCH|nr:hypothetical protein KI387_013293 [Taxus chinensis]
MRIRNHRSSSFNSVADNNNIRGEEESDEEEAASPCPGHGKEKEALTLMEYRPESKQGIAGETESESSSMDQYTPMPTQGLYGMGNKPPQIFRVCKVNKSPWDVPSFFNAFDSLWKDTVDSINTPSPFLQKQTSDDDYELVKKRESLRVSLAKEGEGEANVGQTKLDAEQLLIESAVRSAISEAGEGGLTVREAACKILVDNAASTSTTIPLSVQVRRVMLNSPYFVQLKDGRFALWEDFLSSSGAGTSQLEEYNTVSSSKEDDIPLPLPPRLTFIKGKGKGKRSARRVGCINMREHKYSCSECERVAMGVKRVRKAVKARSLRSLAS